MAHPPQPEVPLCVDLDHTLVRTNTLAESIVGAVRRKPSTLFFLPIWILRGQALLWGRIARIFRPDPTILPYVKPVVDLLRREAASGRSIVLATGAHSSVARDVATQFGFFADIIATQDGAHLTGHAKANALTARFGHRNFDYIADSRTDLPVFRAARRAFVVATSPRLARLLEAESIPATWIPSHAAPSLPGLLSALRPRQWAKNVIVFLPFLLGHRFSELPILLPALAAFALMCAAASAAYLLNDIGDLEADRRHPLKRARPFAAGTASLRLALPLAISLAAASLAFGYLLSPSVALLLALYLAATCLYSAWLKKLLIVDIILLAGFYLLRLFLGAAATSIPISAFTDLFCLLLFTGLATLKRYSEVRNAPARAAGFVERRAYRPDDAAPLLSLANSAFIGAVVAFGLYLGTPAVRDLYRDPDFLWLVCPILLAWTARVSLLAHRGELHGDDPLAFTLRDPWSLAAALLAAAVFVIAL